MTERDLLKLIERIEKLDAEVARHEKIHAESAAEIQRLSLSGEPDDAKLLNQIGVLRDKVAIVESRRPVRAQEREELMSALDDGLEQFCYQTVDPRRAEIEREGRAALRKALEPFFSGDFDHLLGPLFLHTVPAKRAGNLPQWSYAILKEAPDSLVAARKLLARWNEGK